jgi:hypothetical protein
LNKRLNSLIEIITHKLRRESDDAKHQSAEDYLGSFIDKQQHNFSLCMSDPRINLNGLGVLNPAMYAQRDVRTED